MGASSIDLSSGRGGRRYPFHRLATSAVIVLGMTFGVLQLTVTTSNATGGSGTWTAATTEPSLGTTGYMQGVACTTTTTCTAVGQYTQGVADLPLTGYSSDGGVTWSSHFAANGNGTGDTLFATSCATTATCIAVGYTPTSTTDPVIAASSNGGSTYSFESEPTPPAGLDGGNPSGHFALYGVSCISTKCVTVGEYTSGGNYYPLIFHSEDSGQSWATVLRADSPTNTFLAHPEAVTCLSTTTCLMVGWDASPGAGVPYTFVMKTTDGGLTWSRVTSVPSGTFGDELKGISCASATNCVAVGTRNGAGPLELLSTDAGADWASSTSVDAPSSVSAFSGVSCPSTTTCVAAGWGGTGPIKEVADVSHDGGVTWHAATSVPSPDTTTENALLAVSCSGIHCVAGGHSNGSASGSNPAPGIPLMEYADITSVPDAPTAVHATAGVGSATVSWTPPASNGGSAITGYTVTAQPGGATSTTTGSTTTTFGSLTAGTTYTFTVVATNANGNSVASASSAGVVPSAPAVTTTSSAPPAATTTTTVAPTVNSIPFIPVSNPVQAPQPKPAVVQTTFKITSGAVPVTVKCATATCSGTVELTQTTTTKVKVGKKTVTKTTTIILAKHAYRVAKSKSGTVNVTLAAAGKKAFATASKKSVSVNLVITVSGGKTITKSVKVT